MDEFETIVKRYEYENDAKVFSKVLRTAEILLAEDLAPFETEYVLSTLLRKPVDLLQVLSDKRTHREWDSCIREALKLLGQVVTGYPAAEQYYERIVQVCLLHYEPLVRQVALSCLTAVACRSQVGARHFVRHVSALEETTTCKAPLAILVGTICEHHPSMVAEEVTRVWRVYLNLLDSNKYTVTVTKAVLQGVYGLFKHFAMELPTMQLNEFYDKLVSYLDMSRCEEVVLKFLKDYSHLFRERISQDKGVRTLVWRCDSVKARPAILAIYGAVFDTLDIDAIQGILESELYPRTKSPRFYERFTALRVVTDALKRNKARSDLSDHVDLLALELRLRSGNNDYETCEAVSWCVQSAVPFSARLLQAVILCYDRIPANKRKEVVVHSLLLADKEMRTSIVNFLIAESIQPATKEQCKQVWIDIFDTKGTTDIVMEKSAHILQDVIEYVTRAVQMFLEDDVDTQPLPEAIPHLLSLLVSVLRLNAGSDSPCTPLARALRQCARTHPLVAPAAILCGLYNGLVYEELSFDQCSDEDMLLQCALALVESADDVSGKCAPGDMVTALDTIFSRNDIESSVLIKAVQILNKLSQENGELLDKRADIVPKVMKLWRRTDKKTKYDRILHWDVSMFLGKYGKLNYFDEEPTYNKDNVLMYKLRSILVLDIPHDDGNLKVDLPGILHAAVQREDPSALNSLLTIISNNMSKEKSQILQSALLRVVASLSRCEVAADVIRAAVSLCDGGCANELIRYIEREKSSRSRKMLLEALEEILTNHGESLENVLEYVVTNENDFENQAKTEITEFLLNQLKDNNSMCQKYLHSIIMKVLKSDIPSFDIIKMATDLYVDKIELYQTDDIKNVIHKTFGEINSRKSIKFTKITQTAVEFIKRILENKNIPGIENTVEDILELFLENIERDKCDVNLIVFLSILKVFEVDKERLEKMFSENKMEKISKEIHNIWKKLKSASDEILKDDFDIFILLELVREYSEIMATCMRIDCNLLMADLLSKLTPQHVIKFYRKLSKCLPLVDGSCINNSKWFEKQPIKEITDTIEKYSFETRHEEIAQAVKIMMGISHRCGPSAAPVSMIREAGVKRWARWLSQLHCSGYIARNLKSKMAYLFDLADVSFDVLTDEEVVALIKEGGEKSVEFLRDFMPAVFNRLVKRPSVLRDTNMTECCTVLGDVVRHAAQGNRKGDVLDLVDLLWPRYAERSTMEQKHSLLLDLCPLPPDHGVTRWVVTTISSNDTRLEDKIRLLQVLPSVEEYSNLYKSLSSHLPSRLSELHALSSCCFQALLDALADSSDTSDTLLDIVITLAASDNSKGWWDDALDACMRAVARRADPRVSGAVYARCFDGRSLGVCARLVLPLLRYSTPSFCEEFFSNVLEELVSTLKKKPRDVTAHYSYEKCVLDYVRALYILQIVFQKVPKENIQSPRSVLYSKIQGVGDTPSYIVSTVCKLCVTLRTSVTSPPGADDSMKESCRLFHCANYNCLSAAICCTQLKPAVCATVFAASVWDRLIGDEEIRLPVRPQWIQRSTRQAVSIEVVGELSLRTSATMSTVRTQPFLRTLSENPLQYDLLQDEEQTQTQDLQLADNALNKHECAGTLTALLSRMSALESVAWRDALVAALEGDARGNVKWLLSQAIVNCKEDLRPHASALRPALLAVIVQTAANNKLNGLHIDIIDTLIFWKEAATEPCRRLNSAIECIIATAIDNRQNKSVYSMLLEKLTKMLEPSVTISWRCFQKYFEDPKSEYTNCCVDILKRIAKCGVHIPELLPALTDTIEKRRAMSEPTALFALALTAARNRGENETEYLRRYLGVLERLRRTDHAAYIELLHAAQKGFPGCCDDTHFRSITDLTPKVVGRAKLKCLDILAAYVSTAPRGERVTSMFDTVELAEMLPAKEALLLAKNGLHLMNEEQRRSAVSRVVGARAQLPARLRADAYGVLLRALRLLLSPEPTEPSAKRRALESNSLLLSMNDEYTTELLAGVAAGVMERDGDISALVREGVGRCLSKDGGVRLCECFLLTVVLPLSNTSKCPDNILAAMLDLFFQPIREQDAFQRAKLRDDPIELRINVPATSSSRTLTLGNQIRSKQDTAADVNIQTNLAEILKSLLLFLEKTPTACVSVITQLIRTYRAKSPGFDFDAIMSDHWIKCLNNVCGVTPWMLSVIREVDIWDSVFMEITLEHLLLSTKNAAGEDICKLFVEDYKIRRCGDQMFVMGITPATESTDDDMREVSSTFSLQDLFTCFGKLSNWDDLTAREKSTVKTTLPPLWTSRESFNNAIADYDFTGHDCPTWVRAMWSCYSDSARSTYKWLTELLDWPRRSFDISALMETTAWDRIRDSCDAKPTSLPLHIRPSDCLAEWAFRIMMRSSYLHSLSDSASEEVVKLSHSHQLQWCVRASERGLYEQVLQCCKSVTGLYESETLRWLRQKVLAQRAMALETNDRDGLKSALEIAETYTDQFADMSASEDLLGMNEVMLRLKRELRSINHHEMDDTLQKYARAQWLKGGSVSSMTETSKLHIHSMCCAAMSFYYYNELWDTGRTYDKRDLMTYMCESLDLYSELCLGTRGSLLVDMVLDRLDDVDRLPRGETKLLNALKLLRHQVDEPSMSQLVSNASKFWIERERLFAYEAEMSEHRQRLSLLCDPEYLLLQYCKRLTEAAKNDDDAEWRRVHALMTSAVLDNPHAGPDYMVLQKYKRALTDVAAGASKESKLKVLASIQSELKVTAKNTLFVSHLCPALSTMHELERDGDLARLLCLKPGVYVVKFEEKISVFADSIRRPALVRCRLSDGSVARFIVKCGERARPHCVALRLLATARAALPARVTTGYHVTPLSEDCALIQYLEEHERFRALIRASCDVDGLVSTLHRSKDSELILSPKISLQQYNQRCAAVPAYLLRTAIETTCVNIQDFIVKRKNFLNSLCSMTLLSYLYGIGDRHLENMMYSIQDGGACHVDCGAILQYGGGELPPARLTRNVLAVCDLTVLEARLQSVLSSLRDSHELLAPAITVSFKWMNDNEAMTKLQYVKGLLQGTTTSHRVTIEVLSKSVNQYRHKYVELLEDVFADFEDKQTYSVEEQVRSLLRQSTEPRVLSVSRSGWEPWL